jgi:DnaJ-class molecular chaperone
VSELNIVPVSRDKNTITEIKKAYNALTMRVHPDRNSDPSLDDKFTERFKEVANCYEEYKTMK